MGALAASVYQDLRPAGSGGAIATELSDGRLHLQHGPIDLIIDASGEAGAVRAAYATAARRFSTILIELVAELPQLRTPVCNTQGVTGTTAARMWRAANQFLPRFVTPMAAVAGAVADEIISSIGELPGLRRIYVNNGGDIALWLRGKEVFRLGVIPDIAMPLPGDVPTTVRITECSGVGGIATSGWRGRSQSLGIADAVTVFAENAATADVAATLIANAVNIDSRKVIRKSASDLLPDSDLGTRRVTTAVGTLSDVECEAALGAGTARATDMVADSRILAAILWLQGQAKSVGDLANTRLEADAQKYSGVSGVPPISAK